MWEIILNVTAASDRGLQVVAVVATFALLVRVAATGLLRIYWALSAYLTAEVLEGISTLYLPGREAVIFQAGEAVKTALAVLVLLDLSGRVFRNYQALGRFAAQSSKYVLPLCALFGAISFFTDPDVPPGRSPHLHFIVAVHRSLVAALLGYVLAMGAFAGWFPVRMNRNVARLLVGLIVIFGATWIAALLDNAAPRITHLMNSAYWLAILGVEVYWLAHLNRANEQEEAGPVATWDPDRMAEMARQLDQMQAQLSRRGY